MKRLYVLAYVILAAFIFTEIFILNLTTDTNMLLHTTAHMLYDGGLYQRWLTVNSPIIYFIYALPMLISTHLKLSPVILLHGFTAVMCIVSVFFCRYCLRARISVRECNIWVLASAFALIVAPCAFGTYADREHYLFIFGLPWILQMLLRLPPYRSSLLFAMAGFCIKPYNLILIPTLCLLGGPKEWSLRRRIFSPSVMISAAMTVGYIVFLILVFPDYLFNVMPLAMKTYATVGYTLNTRATLAAEYFFIAIIPALSLSSRALRVSFCGLIAAVAVIYCMNAGWSYLYYILSVPVVLLCAAFWLSNDAVSGWKSLRFNRKALAIKALAVFALYSAYYLEVCIVRMEKVYAPCDYNNPPRDINCALKQAAGDDFILISTNLWASSIAAFYGAPHSLYPFDDAPWPLAWIAKHKGEKDADLLWQDIFVMPFVTALTAHPAAALIVDESPGQYSNLFAMLEKEPVVQTTLNEYAPTEHIDRCITEKSFQCRFTIRRRRYTNFH